MVRVGAYVDGFNLYHAIDQLRKPWLKWLNLWALCRSLLKENEELVNVSYFSAVLHTNAEKRARHLEFIRALEAVGVQPRLHGFKKARKYCEREDRYCEFKEEKQTDVAFAVSLISDAYRGTFDRVILVTADSDYIPGVEHLR
jgi:uncharacterized LabA/DUF88 family protein